jgi:hypothetical protein
MPSEDSTLHQSETVTRDLPSAPETLLIEFEGAKFAVATDVREFATLVKQNYRTRLAASATSTVGSLLITRIGPHEFAISGTLEFESELLSPEQLFPSIKHEIARAFMRARPELVWLHAGAVAKDDHAILICGPSGVGKSTLSLALCAAGWRFLSDDIAPISMRENVVIPYFQGAAKRVSPGKFVSADEIRGLELVSVNAEDLCIQLAPAPFTTVIFPQFRPQLGATLEIMPTGQAALELVRNMTNFVDHRDAAVRRARDISLSLPVYTLSYGDEKAAVDVIEQEVTR